MSAQTAPAPQIPITRTAVSRLPELDRANLGFGTVKTDHMLVAQFTDGSWHGAEVVPYGPLPLSPAISGLHYGQSVFEGMKAFRGQDGQVLMFRPLDHLARLNRSAEKLAMPPVPAELFLSGLRTLLEVDEAWLGSEPGSQFYIRPVYFASDTHIGVRPATAYHLVILLLPVGAYYKEPVKVFITQAETRAAPGGVGGAKMAGNYARTMRLGREKAADGFHVVLWTDAVQHKFIEEFSTMNAFFVIDGVVVTPRLGGTILDGMTRNAAIRVLQDLGFRVQERDVSVQELLDMAEAGRLTEMFGTGTAAVVSAVKEVHTESHQFTLKAMSEWTVAPKLLEHLHKLRTGQTEDPYGWVVAV